MDGKVNPRVKKERADRLNALRETMKKERRDIYLGKTIDILVEQIKEGYAYGYTANYLRVKAKVSEIATKINTFVAIKINSLEKGMLIGEKK